VNGKRMALNEDVTGTTISIGENALLVCTAMAGRFPVSSLRSDAGKLTRKTSPLAI